MSRGGSLRPAWGSNGLVSWLFLAGCGVWAVRLLGLSAGGLVPSSGGVELALEFLSTPLRIAQGWEWRDLARVSSIAVAATIQTIYFGAAAMTFAVPAGLVMGLLASARWWSGPQDENRSTAAGAIAVAAHAVARLLVAFARSVHEIVWAVAFLALFGLSPAAAVLSIAIPFAGTLGKVFSELLDEAPTRCAAALSAAGASSRQACVCGALPLASRDMCAYAFYRFECALRAAAVLGFFGFPTLGYYIAESFDSMLFAETWCYLSVLGLLAVVSEQWSIRLRRCFD